MKSLLLEWLSQSCKPSHALRVRRKYLLPQPRCMNGQSTLASDSVTNPNLARKKKYLSEGDRHNHSKLQNFKIVIYLNLPDNQYITIKKDSAGFHRHNCASEYCPLSVSAFSFKKAKSGPIFVLHFGQNTHDKGKNGWEQAHFYTGPQIFQKVKLNN